MCTVYLPEKTNTFYGKLLFWLNSVASTGKHIMLTKKEIYIPKMF